MDYLSSGRRTRTEVIDNCLVEPFARHDCRDSGRLGRDLFGGNAARGLVGRDHLGLPEERVARQDDCFESDPCRATAGRCAVAARTHRPPRANCTARRRADRRCAGRRRTKASPSSGGGRSRRGQGGDAPAASRQPGNRRCPWPRHPTAPATRPSRATPAHRAASRRGPRRRGSARCVSHPGQTQCGAEQLVPILHHLPPPCASIPAYTMRLWDWWS